jgi:hypothetical protein
MKANPIVFCVEKRVCYTDSATLDIISSFNQYTNHFRNSVLLNFARPVKWPQPTRSKLQVATSAVQR